MNTLSRFAIIFFQGRNVLISWLKSLSAVILDSKIIKSVTVFIFSPPVCHEVMGPDAMILVFRMFSFKPDIYFSSSTFIKELFSLSLFSGIRMVASAYLRLLILLQQSWFQLMIHQAWNFAWCTLYISYISRITIYSLDIFFLNFEPIHCSMSGSKCCFLACIQVSQKTGKVVWYSILFESFL